MSGRSVLLLDKTGPRGVVARLTLTRPEVRNAFNAQLIAALHEAFEALNGQSADELRAVVLAGDGPVFCAGADIQWQREAQKLSMAENEADAGRLHDMLGAVDRCPVPVIARVHGAALGGGMALCAVSDIVLAARDTVFGFTETKLGIVPAVIAPYVLPKIGEAHARALFATGQRFDADRALRIGLVHELLPDTDALEARVDDVLKEVLSAGPAAARAAKALVRAIRGLAPSEARAMVTATAARLRVSPEGQEGLAAFLDKRAASWGE